MIFPVDTLNSRNVLEVGMFCVFEIMLYRAGGDDARVHVLDSKTLE